MSIKQKITAIIFAVIVTGMFSFFVYTIFYGLYTQHWIMHWVIAVQGILGSFALYLILAGAIQLYKRDKSKNGSQ